MKKLDKIAEKLQKVPSAIWVILVGISYLFAGLYGLMTTSDAVIAGLNEYMSQMAVEFTGFMDNLYWLLYFEMAVVGIIIFELIIMLVYRYMYNRRFVTANMAHFKTVVRVIYILANTVVGLFSLLYFVLPEMEVYGINIINFIVYTLAFLLIYLVLKESVINPKAVGTAFMKLFTLYFTLEGGLMLLNFILSFTTKGADLHNKLASGIALGVIAASGALIYYFVAKPLIKSEKEYIEIIPPRDDNDPPPEDNEIFRGYGF